MKRLLATAAVLVVGAVSILAADAGSKLTYEIRLQCKENGKQLAAPTIAVREGEPFTFEMGAVVKAPEETGSDREFAAGTKVEGRMYRNDGQLYLEGRVSLANFVVAEGQQPGIRGMSTVLEMVEPIRLAEEVEIKSGAMSVVIKVAKWPDDR